MILAAARTSRTRITNTPRGRMASLGRGTHTHTVFHVHRPIHGRVSTLPTLPLRAHIHTYVNVYTVGICTFMALSMAMVIDFDFGFALAEMFE